MGLSASQSRFLQLTSRRNDNEYQAQQINHARSAVAEKMQQISKKYSEGINNRRLMFLTPVNDGSTAVNSVRLTYNTITAAYPDGLGYSLVTKDGIEVKPLAKETKEIIAEARKNLETAQNTKILKLNQTQADGSNVATPVDGSNFQELLQNYTIKQNGENVNKYSLAEKVQGMDALQFAQYWANNNMSLQVFGQEKENEFITYQVDIDKVEQAEANLEKALKQSEEVQHESFLYDDRCLDPEYLQNQLRSGAWTLQKLDYDDVDLETGAPKKVQVHYGSLALVADELDTDDDASVTAEYNSQMDYYQHKDKQLELELQRLQTSHNAIQTELDSVKKVIEQNVEKSFKTFG